MPATISTRTAQAPVNPVSAAFTLKPATPVADRAPTQTFKHALENAKPNSKSSSASESKPAADPKSAGATAQKSPKKAAVAGKNSSKNDSQTDESEKNSDSPDAAQDTAQESADALPPLPIDSSDPQTSPADALEKDPADKCASTSMDITAAQAQLIAAQTPVPIQVTPTPPAPIADSSEKNASGSTDTPATITQVQTPIDPTANPDPTPPPTNASAAAPTTADVNPADVHPADEASNPLPEKIAAVDQPKPQPVKAQSAKLKVVTPQAPDSDISQDTSPHAAKNSTDTPAAPNPALPEVSPLAAVTAAPAPSDDASSDTSDSPQKSAADLTKTLPTTITDAVTPKATNAAQPHVAAPPVPPITPQTQFIDTNHPKIISGIRGELLPHGGSIQIRLDPPEMGALNVNIKIKDGVVTASFETSNAEATRMLSHSLSDLKSGLEAAGVTVDKIHVQQGPHDQQASAGDDDRRGQQQNQDSSGQREQQRREMLRRMWAKVSGGDPVDLVA